MKEINLRKPWWRFVSVMLSLAMTITLLSGCGPATGKQNASNTKTEVSKNAENTEEAKLSEEVQEHIHTTNHELVENNETVEEILNQLENQLQEGSVDLATESIQTLEDTLAKTEEQTNQWLAAQKEAGTELSKNAQTVLDERNAAFEQELAAKEEEAKTLLSELKTATQDSDTETAKSLAKELQNLLVSQEEPKTYGDTLPEEATVYEPEVVELEGEETDITEASVTETQTIAEDETSSVTPISEEELSELLVTKEDTELNEELVQLTNELGTPLAVYNYLKNNMGYEYYYGSRKGAQGTYAALGGNDLDQASLFIAMLRHLGIEAKYVRGTIHLTEEQAIALTGAGTISHAADVLAAAGTPVTELVMNGETVAIAMEHVWVRAYVPYTDYRGAGKAAGERVWIDLDTSIKAYEEVENLYDMMDEEGFSEEAKQVVEAGDIAAMETLLEEWETELSDKNLDNVYARKRIIKQEELSYLPLSLQYKVSEELETFAHVDHKDKDSVSFSVGGETLGTYTSSALAGTEILLSFRPVSDADAEILNSYDSIFDVPAHSVYLKPVLLINGEVVSEGEDVGTTLGTAQTFTMTLHSGGDSTVVDNKVITGSMYAVTLDNQSITGEELQRVYDEAAALKDTVTEDNVYSEAYLGKLLALAGKLYFAQVDIADTLAAEIYDVTQTRSLSEGITGYEVQTTSLYGVTTGISEGSLYIDVDTDSHSVVSLSGEEDTPKEYMFATGMMSSLYESVVWEELTGIESVSTISILAKAQEENIDILLISKNNLDTEIEKLNTDEATKQTVINAVNSGKIVTIPTEDITMGDWHGTGYIITNPETGAGAYMINGGLNGGALTKIVTGALILNIFLSLVDLAESIGLIITSMAGLIATAPLGTMIIAAALVVVGIACSVFAVIEIGKSLWLYYRYINGDKDAGLDLIENTAYNLLFTLLFVVGSSAAKHFLKNSVKKALYSIMGSDFVERMLKEFDDIFALKKCVKQLQDMGFSVGVIIELSDAFGKKGLDWLLSKKGLGLTDDLVRKIIKAGNLDWFTDDVIRAIINSNGYADDIIDFIKKYGKDAADAIGKYGDDAVEVFKKYGDDAVDGFKNGKTPDEIKADMDNVDSGGGSSSGGDTGTGGGTTGGDNGGAGSGTESGSNTSTVRIADEVLDGEFLKNANVVKEKLPTWAQDTGNFGYCETSINGLDKTKYFAHSGIQTEIPSVKDSGISVKPEKSPFETFKVNGSNIIDAEDAWPRDVDTEYKILSDIQSRLGDNYSASGKIVLYTELEPCPSCLNVIKQFKDMYSHINIEVIYSVKK